jgi:PIN domain nuclease of toxin-antitoxin system
LKILVDTHIFLWMLSCPEKLNEKRRYELESPANEVFLSAMSVAEMMIKSLAGKITIDFDPLEMAEQTQVELLDFSGRDAMIMVRLPLHHKDPFDRMIIAQAISNGFSLMSDDAKFKEYGCKLI